MSEDPDVRAREQADAAIAEHARLRAAAQRGGCLWLLITMPLLGLLLSRLLA